MKNSRYTGGRSKRARRGYSPYLFMGFIPIVFGIVLMFWPKPQAAGRAAPKSMWEIQSVDTMKTSRDKARVKLNDLSYDSSINNQLAAVKSLGANYVALGTPYDDEFLPYLKRWVRIARQHKLKVWFRGNFSRWEGWFDYPKDMSPEEHLKATATFIENNPDLFEEGDIFDPCPECENAEHWPQPEANEAFNRYLEKQEEVSQAAFSKISKKVKSNVFSIIGGRAREVLTSETTEAVLDRVVTIDHYIKDPKNMGEYVDYFARKLGARTLVGEWGAPIPDVNGEMSQAEQAQYVEEILIELYKRKASVYGMNYYVLNEGTTAIINDDGTLREAAGVIKKYYSPAVITGTVKDTIGNPLEGVIITTEDGYSQTLSDKSGQYVLPVPTEPVQIAFGSTYHVPVVRAVNIIKSGPVTENATLDPLEKGVLYKLRLFFSGR